jgi:hypothetical protein
MGFSALLSLAAILVAASYWSFQLISGVTELTNPSLSRLKPRGWSYIAEGLSLRIERARRGSVRVLTVQEQLGAAIKQPS